MPIARINGGEINYTVQGSGPPLVQVPGAATGIQGYRLITPYLKQHFTVLDFDPRGYGQSSRSENGYGFDVWSQDMAAHWWVGREEMGEMSTSESILSPAEVGTQTIS